MSITLIPETAPFNVEQRAWLNGFFAGMWGMNGTPNAAAGLAEAPPAKEAEEDFPWHDADLSIDERMALAEGKPVERKLMAAMAQLDCGSCGYLCQSYAEAIANGSEKSLTKCSPGGKETSKLLKLLVKEAPAKSNGTAKAAPKPQGPSRDRPAKLEVRALRNLNREGSVKTTTHVELELNGSGLGYRVGDSLGIFPTNCSELVSDIVAALNATGEEAVPLETGASVSLREALTSWRCLTEITDELLECLDLTSEPESRFDGMDVLDLLREFPDVDVSPIEFVTALSVVAPRLYSISSSPTMNVGQVHLTVAKVEYPHNGRNRKGVASTMFSDRLKPGDRVRAFVQPSHGFSLPSNPETPLVMVGPGTGIAPFRAFLQERAASKATGRNWLFFGDQHRDFDMLYEEELFGYLESGLLTRLDLAFSRDQEQKIYVQHRMLEEGAELYRWLEEGATFCVCGDAKRMAKDVNQALQTILMEHGNRSPDEATEYVANLKKSGRYLADVY